MGVFGGGFVFVYEFIGFEGLRRVRMFWGTRPADTTAIALWRDVLLWSVERMERPSSIVWIGVILPVVISEIRDESSNISRV